jgi:3-deoxy-D-manno-octulosonic-acid transferase
MMVLPLSLRLYGVATAALEPLVPSVLANRARRGKEDPQRLTERLGRSAVPRPSGTLVWLHGASIGESLSLLPLIAALKSRRPDLAILVTSGTVTSAELLKQRLPSDVIHQFAPVDAPGVVKRFLDHWRPDLAVFVESELWPNLLVAARKRDIPTALISARLSEASFSGWSRSPAAARALLSGFQLVMAQDGSTAGRLSSLGAPDHGRLNLKLAGDPPPVDEAALASLRQVAAGRPVLLAASTHPGEEYVVLEAFASLADRPDRPLLVIVPRHPARGIEIAAPAMGRQSGGDRFGATPIYVADTLGEMGIWLSLAVSVFIGGSLVADVGGHNPIEAAKLGTPVVSGRRFENWRYIYASLFVANAAKFVGNAADLARAWAADLDSPTDAKARAERAKIDVDKGAAGLDGAADALIGLLS